MFLYFDTFEWNTDCHSVCGFPTHVSPAYRHKNHHQGRQGVLSLTCNNLPAESSSSFDSVRLMPDRASYNNGSVSEMSCLYNILAPVVPATLFKQSIKRSVHTQWQLQQMWSFLFHKIFWKPVRTHTLAHTKIFQILVTPTFNLRFLRHCILLVCPNDFISC